MKHCIFARLGSEIKSFASFSLISSFIFMSYKYRLQRQRGPGGRLLLVALGLAAGTALSNYYVSRQLAKRELILALDLQHPYSETKPNFALFEPKALSHYELLRSIEAASKDKRVKGIIANLTERTPLPLAQAQEIREAIIKFKNSHLTTEQSDNPAENASKTKKKPDSPPVKKFAYVYADSFDKNTNYYLATAFDKVLLNPAGDVGVTALLLEQPFVRGLLEKLNILPQFGKRKAYKNAPDMFTEKHMSPAHQEAMQSLGSSLYDQIITAVAQGRGIAESNVREIFAHGPYNAEEAKNLGLIDELIYESSLAPAVKLTGSGLLEADKLLLSNLQQNTQENKQPPSSLPWKISNFVSPVQIQRFHTYAQQYLKAAKVQEELEKGRGAPKIALIYGLGAVTNQNPGPWQRGDEFYSSRLVKTIDSAAKDPKVSSIVFRIDSPGGSYTASDTVYAALEEAKRKGKKIIVSMGNVAASGGYFAAAPADYIVANPGTITGSIGVFSGKFYIGKMLENHLNINVDKLPIGGNNGGFYSATVPFNEFHWNKLNSALDRIYADFVGKVALGRRISIAEVDKVAQGRVWTGVQALNNGLIDRTGGLIEAISLARDQLPEKTRESAVVEQFPRRRGLMAVLAQQYGAENDAGE
jgi:protease-4